MQGSKSGLPNLLNKSEQTQINSEHSPKESSVETSSSFENSEDEEKREFERAKSIKTRTKEGTDKLRKGLKTCTCLVSVNSSHKTRWDAFILLLATVNCFMIPIEVSFKPEFTTLMTYDLASNAIDVFS